jgi:signal transduction histidine kinase
MALFQCYKDKTINRLLLENTEGIVLFFDRQGRITDYNAIALKELGFQKEIKQYKIQDIFRNSVIYENQKLIIRDCLEKSEETIAYRKNQTCFPVDLKITIHHKNNSYIGICVAKNITEYKELHLRIDQLEKNVESLQRSRNEIAANVGHELRTPVNGIMGLSNNLLDTSLTPEQVEIVQLMKRCCSNMDSVINDLLDYAKLTNNKMVLEQREFGFREFIRTVINMNKPRINEKGLYLHLYIAEDIPDRIIGDELRLTQILNNLISNAIKFTTIGHITLEVAKLSHTRQSVELFFILIDTGIGINEEDRDKLFQSFSQVDGSITRRFGGTGLGLAISKKLVEAMGGSIGVDSERGKGSTFSFSVRLGLPIEEHKAEGIDIQESSTDGIKDNQNNTDNSNRKRMIQKFNDISDIDQLLKEAGGIHRSTNTEPPSKELIYRSVLSILEKLAICIEMESWDKAEELAYLIRKQLTPDFGDVTKIVFRLLLAVRKENRASSLSLIKELKDYLVM